MEKFLEGIVRFIEVHKVRWYGDMKRRVPMERRRETLWNIPRAMSRESGRTRCEGNMKKLEMGKWRELLNEMEKWCD